MESMKMESIIQRAADNYISCRYGHFIVLTEYFALIEKWNVTLKFGSVEVAEYNQLSLFTLLKTFHYTSN